MKGRVKRLLREAEAETMTLQCPECDEGQSVSGINIGGAIDDGDGYGT